MYKIGVIVASDKGHQGLREDKSGLLIKDILEKENCEIVEYKIVPDSIDELKKEMSLLCDVKKVDLLLTTGGTGFSSRDVTPEATLAICERMAQGISEAIRLKCIENAPNAMLSRAVSGIRGKTLIINLPGSPKGVKESLNVIIPTIFHGLDVLIGESVECGSEK